MARRFGLASDGFNEKYELEGSAKVIERVRSLKDIPEQFACPVLQAA